MKNKVLLFSTRDIGINGSLFENANPHISKELCNFFIKENQKELYELKKNLLSESNISSTTEKPSLGDAYEKICEIYGDDLPTEINEAYRDGLDALIARTEEILNNNPNEDLSEFLMTVKGGKPVIPSFVLKDFDTFLKAPAINIEKSEKTLKERISIYSLKGGIYKDNGSDVKYQVFAVWSLGEGVSDSSWEEALVKCILEQIKNEPEDQRVDEIDIFLFLHDKDLERTYNKPFRTEYVRRLYDEKVKNVVYTFTSFTHADFEYTNIKSKTKVPLPELFSDIEKLTIDSYVFQKLLDLSDQLAKWQRCNQKSLFASGLIDFVGKEEWNSDRWQGLRKTVDQIREWDKLPNEDKRKTFLNLNDKINIEIKNLRNRG